MRVSVVIRRSHMYLALFFTPWIAVYALSTLFFNHGIRGGTPEAAARGPEGAPISFVKESESVYSRIFPIGTTPKVMAAQILADLKLSGTHFAFERMDGMVIINRRDPITPRRLTYDPDTGDLLVEKQVMGFPTWLRTLHHRTGYKVGETRENTWAFFVDLAILAMIFWAVSGIWMCVELKATRTWGVVCTLAGIGLFTFLALSL
ncbi:MAG: PepSY-associated TM helix domain-containing protein [Acidobacteriota bacterium]